MAKLSNKDDSEDKDASKDQNHPEVDTPVSTEEAPQRKEETAARRDRLLQTALELLRIKATREKQWDVYNFDLLNREWVGSFKDAIKSADLFLREFEEREEEIHAYQLFEPEEQYTAEEIGKKFDEYKWQGMSTKNTVTKELDEIRKALKNQIREIKEHALSGEDKEFSEAMLKFRDHIEKITGMNALTTIYPKLKHELQEIEANIGREYAPADFDEITPAYYDYKGFLKYCFIEEEGPKVYRYRAREIFLFAAKKKLLRKKLIKPLKSLSAEFISCPHVRDLDSAFNEILRAIKTEADDD